MAATPADSDAAQMKAASGGTGSAAATDAIEGSAGSRIDPPATVTNPERPTAAASDGDRSRYDDARELVSGNSGGRG
jgi:hypothetical protein